MSEILPTLTKAILEVPDLLKEIYSDAAKPGVKQVGIAIGGILGLGNTVLYPIHLLNNKTSINLKNNLERYRAKIEEIPEEDISPVPPEIGVPITEKLAYISNEELSDMYTSLLAKASSKINADQAHPGFVSIIERLSPDEAILIKKFDRELYIPFVDVILKHSDGKSYIHKSLAIHERFYAELQQPKNVPAYLTNLNALGIIDIRHDSYDSRKELYIPLQQYYEAELQPYIKAGMSFELKKSVIIITPIGQLFIKACFTKLKRNAT